MMCAHQTETQRRHSLKIDFRTIKEYVQVPQAAVFYGMEIIRSKMTNCPFHGDRTPSMKLNDKYYYCFGCQVSGDVIDLTAQLLGVNLRQAAIRLTNDFHLQGRPVVIQTPQEIAQKNQRNELKELRKTLLTYEGILLKWKSDYAPATPEEMVNERYAEACQMLDTITYLIDSLTFGTDEMKQMTLDTFRQDDLLNTLKERIDVTIQEETDAG
ncbi:MAG: DNA primase [Clostridiales bacterium]|nr:DNA primase [Clostridiales bacterium]